MIETRGTERLSSQTLLDVRVVESVPRRRPGTAGRVLDVLNVLDDTAEESHRTDVMTKPDPVFGEGAIFIDPRRAMLSLRLNLGR